MDINKIGTTFAISNAYCRVVSHTKTALRQVPEVKTVVLPSYQIGQLGLFCSVWPTSHSKVIWGLT